VIDFGVAKATTNQQLTDKTLFTAFEMLIGTPAYMSPEQAAPTSADVDTRTDIYSLGVLLYELLTGSTPFDAGELLKTGLDEIRRVIREEDPVRPSTRLSTMNGKDLTTVALHRQSESPRLIRAISGDLDWIAMKALEKDRTRRYETAFGLALDVQRYLADEPISARPPSKLYRFQKVLLRNKLLFAGLGVIAVLLVATLIIVSASLAKERRSRREAEAAQAKAETEAVKSRQITQFLEDMLQGVGPSVARGRDTAMLREILDRTAGRVGTSMTNQPAVEAELRSLIGRLYLEIGNYDEAEKMDRLALAINRKLFGPESPEAAASLNDLGFVLSKEGSLAEAESTLQEALAIRRRLLGNKNQDVAASINYLATVLRHQRRLVESEALTREALGIRQKLFGDDSLEVADSLHNLSIVLGDEGQKDESEATARRMLAMRRKLLGPEDPLVAAALNDVAWAAGGNGKLDEAKSLQREALAMQRKLLGDENPAVAATLSSLGQRMRQAGNLTDADGVLNAALSIQRKLLGENSPDFLYTLDSLGLTLAAEGKWAEAETAHREMLAVWRKRGGDETPQALSALGNLIRDLMAEKKFGEAEQLLDEVLTPAFISQSSSADPLALRSDLEARRGAWQEAATDAVQAFEHQPFARGRYTMVAGLLAKTRNHPAYEQFCQRLLVMFPTTSDVFVADDVAKGCLFLPDSGLDLKVIGHLADVAVTRGTGDDFAMPFFQVCEALSEYRQGHFAGAVEWAQKSLKNPRIESHGHACAVLAMAYWQLGKKDEARAMLAEGNALAPSILPVHDAEDPGNAWLRWLYARISLDEATARIQPASTTGNSPNEP
jgi:eukaryotic-like serine/threonine-protein kinase